MKLTEELRKFLGLEVVMEFNSFYLVKVGQRYGIGWCIRNEELLMIRNIKSHSGKPVCYPNEVAPLLFKTDGELRVSIAEDSGANPHREYEFDEFQREVLKYLDKEDQ
jgi:hypothetical protein